jgi:hypothetical protein
MPVDNATFLQLVPAASDVVNLDLFGDPRAASQDPACPDTAETGVGTGALDLATWIRGVQV